MEENSTSVIEVLNDIDNSSKGSTEVTTSVDLSPIITELKDINVNLQLQNNFSYIGLVAMGVILCSCLLYKVLKSFF